MKCFQKHFLLIALVIVGGMLLLFPDVSKASVQQGLMLCSEAILPNLFPFLILTNLWIKLQPPTINNRLFSAIFGLPSDACTAWIFGTIAGYPVGSKIIAEQYASGRLTKKQAEHSLLFCCNAGPAFSIGVIGGFIFNKISWGIIIYAIHLAASIILGIMFRMPSGDYAYAKKEQSPTHRLPTMFVSSCFEAFDTTLQICGFILLFSILTGHLCNLLPASIAMYLTGFIELTTGVYIIKDLPFPLLFVLSSVFLGWGGLCVLLQTISILLPSGLSIQSYLFGKALQAVISGALACTLLFLFEGHYQWICIFILELLALYLFLKAKSSTGKPEANGL